MHVRASKWVSERESEKKQKNNTHNDVTGTLKSKQLQSFYTQNGAGDVQWHSGGNNSQEIGWCTEEGGNPSNLRCSANAGLPLAHRLRLWANINPALTQRSVFAGYSASQQTQTICITFQQRRPNVFEVGPTLYRCYTMFCVCWIGRCMEGWTFYPDHVQSPPSPPDLLLKPK